MIALYPSFLFVDRSSASGPRRAHNDFHPSFATVGFKRGIKDLASLNGASVETCPMVQL
jgi:hypothetical protein